MEVFFVLWLAWALSSRRKRTYTRAQLEAIKREAAKREGPALEDQSKPYRWWKFYWS